MTGNYIDFISAYCDRWCERCQFTTRCSAYAAEVAIAMCGDVAQGLELAVGLPANPHAGPAIPAAAEWLADVDDAQTTEEERKERERRDQECRARVDNEPIVKAAWVFSTDAHKWLKAHGTAMRAHDPVVDEALAVAAHDALLITAKLSRAMRGRDEWMHGEAADAPPVQNDWNGSAKLVLVLLARSMDAWRLIAEANRDAGADALVRQAVALREGIEHIFPNARAFIRPGFDECGGE